MARLSNKVREAPSRAAAALKGGKNTAAFT
jgi:hypothetical protein